jgi:hypothetical protein
MGRRRWLDQAAAQYFAAVEEDNRLSGRDRSHRLIEPQLRPVAVRRDGSSRVLAVVTDARLYANRTGWLGTRNPRDSRSPQLILEQLCRIADGNVAGCRVDVGDKNRSASATGNWQPFALANRELVNAIVLAKNRAVRPAEYPGNALLHAPLDELFVVARRDEADVLAVRLVCNWQPKPGCHCPNLIFRVFANWESEPCKIFLRQRVEDIGLVLERVNTAQQTVFAV